MSNAMRGLNPAVCVESSGCYVDNDYVYDDDNFKGFKEILSKRYQDQFPVKETFPWLHFFADGSTFDFIIVGAGTAGSTLAARLAAADFSVLVLEAGPEPPHESIVSRDTPCYLLAYSLQFLSE